MRRSLFALTCAIAIGAVLTGCANPANETAPTPTPEATATPAPSAEAVNHPPVANAGADFAVDVSETVRLSAAATDEDGDALSYSWSFARPIPVGSKLADASIGARTSAAASFKPDRAGEYLLDVAVSDGSAIVTDRIVVTATFGNAAPVVKALASASYCPPGTTVVFAGNVTDPDRSVQAYSLSFQSQPEGSGLAFAPDPGLYPSGSDMAPQSQTLEIAGTYVVRLSAADPEGHIGYDEVTVVVAEPNPDGNTAPFAEAGDDITVTQNAYDSVLISSSGSYDPDGDPLSATWECISAPEAYSGDLGFINGTFPPAGPEIPVPLFLAAGQYVFQLTIDDLQEFGESGDGTNQASIARDTMTLTIRNASPVVDAFFLGSNLVDLSISSPQLVACGVLVVDSDVAMSTGSGIAFALQAPAGSASVLLDPGYMRDTPIIDCQTAFQVDIPGTYTVTLTVTDGEVATVYRLQTRAYNSEEQGGEVNVGIN